MGHLSEDLSPLLPHCALVMPSSRDAQLSIKRKGGPGPTHTVPRHQHET